VTAPRSSGAARCQAALSRPPSRLRPIHRPKSVARRGRRRATRRRLSMSSPGCASFCLLRRPATSGCCLRAEPPRHELSGSSGLRPGEVTLRLRGILVSQLHARSMALASGLAHHLGSARRRGGEKKCGGQTAPATRRGELGGIPGAGRGERRGETKRRCGARCAEGLPATRHGRGGPTSRAPAADRCVPAARERTTTRRARQAPAGRRF